MYTQTQKTYLFCGIGGSGMSALASVLLKKGNRVYGSDRSYDQGKFPQVFSKLETLGVRLFPQDGSGLGDVDVLVVSSAVEPSIPDVKAALEKNIPIMKRAELLAELFNAARGLAVGGTSGKSTTTGLLAHILRRVGHVPTVVNGAIMPNFIAEIDDSFGNACVGTGEDFVIEADESDGSIAFYEPDVSLLNNITLDHKPVAELRGLFTDFLAKAKTGAVVNLDDGEAALLKDIHPQTLTYGIGQPEAALNAVDVTPTLHGVSFVVEGVQVNLPLTGRHNVSNALAAMAVAKLVGVSLKESAQALLDFKGIKSRLEIIGTAGGITIIDDFAHNPDKISAALAALKENNGRLLIMFQMQGFGPAKMMRDELIAAFAEGLGEDDILYMPEIFYAGGTADKSISAQDFTSAIAAQGKQTAFFETKDDVYGVLMREARAGDRIIIMGARDDGLRQMAARLAQDIAQRSAVA